MSIELKIPAVGESITEVQIGEWLKSEGDMVKQDEPLAVIDSEKTTLELPAPQNGRLTKILHQAGETVAVGAVVARLEQDGQKAEETSKPEDKSSGQKKAANGEASVEDKEKPSTHPAAKPKQSKASETGPQPDAADEAAMAAQKESEESSPDDLKVESSVADKTTEPNAASETKAPKVQALPVAGREEEKVPMTMLRRTAARRLVEAQQAMAMPTTFNEVDMSGVQSLRSEYQEAFEKKYQVKLGLMSFFIKAAVDALRQFPKLNAEIRGNDIIYRNYFDIGVAVASERGLVVPVVRDAQSLAFAELEKTVGDFARRARDGHLKPDELEGGTFTITNGGVFGSLLSTPIINPPQSGILGLHSIQDRPVAVQGQVTVRPMMYIALTYDHRLVDGREAVLFLKRIKQVIETPARMLIEV